MNNEPFIAKGKAKGLNSGARIYPILFHNQNLSRSKAFAVWTETYLQVCFSGIYSIAISLINQIIYSSVLHFATTKYK